MAKRGLPVEDYRQAAKDDEDVFRNVLRDLKTCQRPFGFLVPSDLETELPVDDIYLKYSAGDRYGLFTICSFEAGKGTAKIAFKNVATLSGGGAELEYIVNSDNSVDYKALGYSFRC